MIRAAANYLKILKVCNREKLIYRRTITCGERMWGTDLSLSIRTKLWRASEEEGYGR